MNDVVVKQMPAFRKAYKKLHAQEKENVDAALRTIIKTPEVGKEKKGDLSGVFVYKFKINHQEMLLAYEWNRSKRLLLALGAHENFYRDLKKQH